MSSPKPHNRVKSYFVLAIIGFACLSALVLGRPGTPPSDLLGIDQVQSAGSGSLEVGTTTYLFELDACAIGDTEFVAAGFGSVDGNRFRVRASIGSIDLAFGTVDELDRPTSESIWLRSDNPPDWVSDKNQITANALLLDPRDPDSFKVDAELSLTCPSNNSTRTNLAKSAN